MQLTFVISFGIQVVVRMLFKIMPRVKASRGIFQIILKASVVKHDAI